MSDLRKIDPAYYENRCFGDELAEAESGGCLIVSEPGEGALDAIERYAQSRRETAIPAVSR